VARTKTEKLYLPTDIAVDITGNAVYVVEHFNDKISKWDYDPTASGDARFNFGIDAGKILSIAVNQGGNSYTFNPPVVIGPPNANILNPIQATATATITGDMVTSITVVNPGNGYVSPPPSIMIFGDGSAATADATLNTPWGNNGDGTTGQSGNVASPTDNFLDRPTGITFDGTRLYVTDTFHNRIRTIRLSDGVFLGSTGQGGGGLNDFYRPTGIAVNSPNTKIVIADKFNKRAVRYDVGDTPSNPLVLTKPTPKEFVRPHSVSFDEEDNKFLVSDTFTNVLSKYNFDAVTFESQIGKASGGDGNDDLYFPGKGTGLTPAFELVFANTRKNSLKEFDEASGLLNFLTNVTGTDDGQLYWPESSIVFTDTSVNYLLVVNTRNQRVDVFEQPSTFKSTFGTFV